MDPSSFLGDTPANSAIWRRVWCTFMSNGKSETHMETFLQVFSGSGGFQDYMKQSFLVHLLRLDSSG